MLINPVNSISFGKTMYIKSSEVGGKEALWDEAQKASELRTKFGADIPIIGHAKLAGDDVQVKYEVEGKQADIYTNPIRREHLRNLFKNFFALDRAGVLHKDLSLEHLYFSDNGKVEIGGFGNFARYSALEQPQVPSKNMPSNALEFEESGLYQYVSTLEGEAEKIGFLKDYLQAKSDYHRQRAEYLMTKKGLDLADSAVADEIARAEVFLNPDKEVLNFELEKLNLLSMGEHALDLWKDGCGSTDGKTKAKQKINSMLLLFDCLKYGMQLRDVADDLTVFEADSYKAKYFESEKAYMDNLNQELFETINLGTKKVLSKRKAKTAGGRTVFATEQEEQFEKLCSKIDIKRPYGAQKNNIDKAYSYLGSCYCADYKYQDAQGNYTLRYANYA